MPRWSARSAADLPHRSRSAAGAEATPPPARRRRTPAPPARSCTWRPSDPCGDQILGQARAEHAPILGRETPSIHVVPPRTFSHSPSRRPSQLVWKTSKLAREVLDLVGWDPRREPDGRDHRADPLGEPVGVEAGQQPRLACIEHEHLLGGVNQVVEGHRSGCPAPGSDASCRGRSCRSRGRTESRARQGGPFDHPGRFRGRECCAPYRPAPWAQAPSPGTRAQPTRARAVSPARTPPPSTATRVRTFACRPLRAAARAGAATNPYVPSAAAASRTNSRREIPADLPHSDDMPRQNYCI